MQQQIERQNMILNFRPHGGIMLSNQIDKVFETYTTILTYSNLLAKIVESPTTTSISYPKAKSYKVRCLSK